MIIFYFLFLIVGTTFTTEQKLHTDKGSKIMLLQKTFAIIKPDAVKAKNSGQIIDLVEKNGFKILRIQKLQFTKKQAEQFYDIHKERPFFKELVDFIISAPSIIMVLEKENAIADWRKLMGATDPLKADVGTIRKMFGQNIGNNATHGSDQEDTAKKEIGQFFPDLI